MWLEGGCRASFHGKQGRSCGAKLALGNIDLAAVCEGMKMNDSNGVRERFGKMDMIGCDATLYTHIGCFRMMDCGHLPFLRWRHTVSLMLCTCTDACTAKGTLRRVANADATYASSPSGAERWCETVALYYPWEMLHLVRNEEAYNLAQRFEILARGRCEDAGDRPPQCSAHCYKL